MATDFEEKLRDAIRQRRAGAKPLGGRNLSQSKRAVQGIATPEGEALYVVWWGNQTGMNLIISIYYATTAASGVQQNEQVAPYNQTTPYLLGPCPNLQAYVCVIYDEQGNELAEWPDGSVMTPQIAQQQYGMEPCINAWDIS